MSDSQTISDIKKQDLFNNNHMASLSLEEKPKSPIRRDQIGSPRPLSSSSSSYLFDPSLLLRIKPDSFRFQYDKYERLSNSGKFHPSCIYLSY